MSYDELEELCLACLPELYTETVKFITERETKCIKENLKYFHEGETREEEHTMYPCKVQYIREQKQLFFNYFVTGSPRTHMFRRNLRYFLRFQHKEGTDDGPVKLKAMYVQIKQKMEQNGH